MDRAMAMASLTSIDMLARVVAFDTTSRNSNLDIIGFVRAWLDAHGVPYRLSFDPTGQKANLHATIGPVQPGGFALAGHVDTVPTDGQTWTGDPYSLRRQDGRLIARGTCDMKGFVAAALAAVPDLKARKLARPVHLLLTYDEEVGYHGARRLVEDIGESGLRPDTCLVGEASSMLPIFGAKGRLNFRASVRGHAAHSSAAHQGVNAVHAAAEAVAWLATESRRLARNGPFEAGFDPPHSTLQVSSITSHGLPNTVPDRAAFEVEWRNIPADDSIRELARLQAHVATTIEPRMHELNPETGFDYQVLLDLAALSLPPEHELARAACAVTGAVAGGKLSYCCEAALFQPAGMACLVCGPGDIAQLHQADEWIAESQLAACDAFIRGMADRLAA